MTRTLRAAIRHVLFAGLSVSAVAACSAPPPVTAAQPGPPVGAAAQGASTVLKAVLFPYIPDSAGDNFQSLIQRLESGFESTHPGVDVQITINASIDVYDYGPNGTLSKLLGSGPDAVQVVEVDTLLMGNLTQSGWVQPVGMANPGVLPTAWQAATVQNVTYGVPTYLCSNVIYSESSAVTAAANGTNLVGILSGVKPGTRPLVGNYAGSWTLPSFYVDAWADTEGTAGMATAYQLPLDQKTMMFFSSVVNVCATNATTNPCLNGAYANNTAAETAFASGAANGFIGYTERLFYIRKANPQRPLPSVTSAPIGGGSNPAMFVDALVFNPSCTGACLGAAQAFAAYMSSVPVRNLIAFSQDGPPGTLPRYLLQANEVFYASQPAASDPMYRAYAPIVRAARPYPNSGFPDSRRALNQALLATFAPTVKEKPAPAPPPERRAPPPP